MDAQTTTCGFDISEFTRLRRQRQLARTVASVLRTLDSNDSLFSGFLFEFALLESLWSSSIAKLGNPPMSLAFCTVLTCMKLWIPGDPKERLLYKWSQGIKTLHIAKGFIWYATSAFTVISTTTQRYHVFSRHLRQTALSFRILHRRHNCSLNGNYFDFVSFIHT